MLATDFERFNGRIVANYQPTSYLKVGVNLAASYQNSEEGNANSEELGATTNPFLAQFYPPIQSYYAHEEDGSIKYENGNPVWNIDGLNKGSNIAWIMRLDKKDYTTNNISGSVYGTAIIPYGFEFTVRGNISRIKQTGTEYANNIIGAQQGNGGLDLINYNQGSHTFMQTLTWSRTNMVRTTLMRCSTTRTTSTVTKQYFERKSASFLPTTSRSTTSETLMLTLKLLLPYRTESYLGRVRYNYDRKYFGEVSIRRDGTSRFAKNNRWKTFGR